MISATTIKILKLVVSYGNLIRLFPFEWNNETQRLQSLKYKPFKWRCTQCIMFTHLIYRAIDMVFILHLIVFQTEDLRILDILFGIFFIAVFSVSCGLLLEYFYHSEEILEVLNNTLSMDNQMSKLTFCCFELSHL